MKDVGYGNQEQELDGIIDEYDRISDKDSYRAKELRKLYKEKHGEYVAKMKNVGHNTYYDNKVK